MKKVDTKVIRRFALILLCIIVVAVIGYQSLTYMRDNGIYYKKFKNADIEYSTIPLWFWNDNVSDMTEEKVREIVRESYQQSGYNGMAILPNWIEGYLSDDYFRLYRAALDEGRKYGMHFVLYDENGFPSYNAGGLLASQYPDLTAKRLDKYEQDCLGYSSCQINLPQGECMGAVAMNTDTLERINITQSVIKNSDGTYLLNYTTGEGNWKIMAFMCVPDGSDGMDYLNSDSVRAFIDITYEKYYRELQEFFDDKTIMGAFYDEPTFWPWGDEKHYGVEGARTWTDSINDEYQKIYDDDPVLNYPALWYDIGEATNQARNRLLGIRTQMYSDNYIGQINQWCNNHEITLTGHMLLEEWVNPVGLHGDLMKVFKNQDIPGVDVIAGYGNAQQAYKIISSSAYNWDKSLIMSESFGGMGNEVPISTLYKTTIDLYTKGINDIVPHAIWYNDLPEKVDAPPELSYRSSFYGKDLKQLNQYISRLNVLLQDGRHVADIAVLYPIDYLESVYLFNEDPNNPEDADYMEVGEYLSLTERKDFTYMHPEMLNEKCVITDEGNLRLDNENNYEEYSVFILPGMKLIDLENLKKIKDFYDSGGNVIATTQLPYQGTNEEDNEAVKNIVIEMFGIDPETGQNINAVRDGNVLRKGNASGGNAYFTGEDFQSGIGYIFDNSSLNFDVDIDNVQIEKLENGNLAYIHKVKGDMDIYYFGNSSDNSQSFSVDIKGNLSNLQLWNPANGTKERLEYKIVEKENGEIVTKVNLTINATDSIFVVSEKEN